MIEAIVPVRGLPAGKTRLAALLTPDQRNRLVRAMLEDVIAALRSTASVDRITIFSRDAAAAREAESLGVDFLHQPPDVRDLNAGLAFAQEQRAAAGALLIVPADVPLLSAADVDAVVASGAARESVVIVPADDGGTNGLLLRPPGIVAPSFGTDSAKRHEDAARAAGATCRTVQSQSWALDIDRPEDLARLLAVVEARPDAASLRTVRCLRGADFPAIAPLRVPGG